MDDLPPPLIVDILSRLTDSADLARCRMSSKIFNSLSKEVRSINLNCSIERYAKSRSPLNLESITPFKSILKRLISELRVVESVCIGVQRPLHTVSYDDEEDEDDDLYLTGDNFVSEWLLLPQVRDGLKLLSISDFWIQSCWRRSNVLSPISSHCHNLVELVIKNAWLSVDDLNPMPKLLKLTLEYIRLDDEDLNKVNQCFPSLRVLNLIGVGGLKDPKVHLLHLETCKWAVSNAVYSITIIAPSLVQLKLKCVRPKTLVIETPSLFDLHLYLERTDNFKVQEFCNLTNLHLESPNFHNFIPITFGKTIKNLKLGSRTSAHPEMAKFGISSLFCVFPNISSLTLMPWAWSALSMFLYTEDPKVNSWTRGLKEITVYLEVHDFEITLWCIFYILDNCPKLSDMKVLIHRDVVLRVTDSLISRCMGHSPRVRWRWGMWKTGTKDAWLPDGNLLTLTL